MEVHWAQLHPQGTLVNNHRKQRPSFSRHCPRNSSVWARPYTPKFQVQGVAPTNNLCTVSKADEWLTTLPLTVFTQKKTL